MHIDRTLELLVALKAVREFTEIQEHSSIMCMMYMEVTHSLLKLYQEIMIRQDERGPLHVLMSQLIVTTSPVHPLKMC